MTASSPTFFSPSTFLTDLSFFPSSFQEDARENQPPSYDFQRGLSDGNLASSHAAADDLSHPMLNEVKPMHALSSTPEQLIVFLAASPRYHYFRFSTPAS
jgi:hypothetical protein